MDDGIAAGKRRERLRPQQAMGIGNRPNGSHHARPDYKRSRVRREPRAIGSATDKLPSKHPAAIPGWGSPSAEERLGHPATAQPFSAVGLVVVLLANGFTPECLFFRDAPLAAPSRDPPHCFHRWEVLVRRRQDCANILGTPNSM